tara:strand:- start:873 stop:1004 length:132 start_codon:yes stop_codon:yes gene_type:complete
MWSGRSAPGKIIDPLRGKTGIILGSSLKEGVLLKLFIILTKNY